MFLNTSLLKQLENVPLSHNFQCPKNVSTRISNVSVNSPSLKNNSNNNIEKIFIINELFVSFQNLFYSITIYSYKKCPIKKLKEIDFPASTHFPQKFQILRFPT